MKNQEAKRLFERWGFEPEEGNGGHLVMRHRDTSARVQITAPGRSTTTPPEAFRKAAAVVGVSLSTFRRGPERERSAQPPTVVHARAELEHRLAVEWRRPLPRGTSQPANEWVRPEPEPIVELPPPVNIARRKRGSTSSAVLRLLQVDPSRVFSLDEITEATGLDRVQARSAIQTLERAGASERAGYGRYRAALDSWLATSSTAEPIEIEPDEDEIEYSALRRLREVQARIERERRPEPRPEEPPEPTPEPEPAIEPETFTLVGIDNRNGLVRLLLEDETGHPFIATRTFLDVDRSVFAPIVRRDVLVRGDVQLPVDTEAPRTTEMAD